MANYAWFTKAHRWLYHKTGGRIGASILGYPMTLMYTTGAKSGQLRMVPLVYYPLDPAGIIILGSNNGQPKPPAWYHNLKAHPEFEILVGRERRRVRAEALDQARRAEVWPQMVARNPLIQGYADRAGRELPIILLRTLAVL